MKKLSALFIAIFMGISAFNAAWAIKTIVITPLVRSGIQKYKVGNYLGAKQDIQDAISKNPNDPIANYYLGNVYTKIGDKDKAVGAYQRVIEINENKGLSTYAGVAIICLNEPVAKAEFVNPVDAAVGNPVQNAEQASACTNAKNMLKGSEAEQDMNAFIRSGQFMHQEARDKIKEKSLQNVQQKINSDEKNIDFSEFKYLNDASGAMPSDKEIADAVKTLAKAGFNPLNYTTTQGFSPQLAQLNYMVPNNNNANSGFEMLPYLMQHDGYKDGKVSPQLLQNMMMGQLMSSYDLGGTSNNRGF